MINRIMALFGERERRPLSGGRRHSAKELHIAAAALLVEAARLDGRFDEAEREKIRSLVGTRFGLAAGETESLIGFAEEAASRTNQLVGFTRTVKDLFSSDERVGMIEMLWEVAHADGVVHAYEANLIRRIAGLIYVSDRERGEARKRVAARHGLDGKHRSARKATRERSGRSSTRRVE